jgi:hypothetical protein
MLTFKHPLFLEMIERRGHGDPDYLQGCVSYFENPGIQPHPSSVTDGRYRGWLDAHDMHSHLALPASDIVAVDQAPRLRRIISGGQTGADRGGLDAAIALGLDWGGYCTCDCKAEDGRIPDLYLVKITPLPSNHYQPRTRKNAQETDATLIFNASRTSLSRGSLLTKECAERKSRPFHLILGMPTKAPAADDIRAAAAFIAQHDPAILNVAGNREGRAPGMQVYTATFVTAAVRLAQTESLAALRPSVSHEPAAGTQLRLL